MMHWNGFGVWPWWGLIMMALWVLAIVGIILLIVWLLRLGTTRGPDRTPGGNARDPALQILRERFARGEISREEFEEMRQALE